MSTVAAQHRQLYRDIFTGVPAYCTHAPGEQYLPVFLDMVQVTTGTVLDAGSGSGKGAVALAGAGFTVTCCDFEDFRMPACKNPTIQCIQACLWDDLRHLTDQLGGTFDFVYCCDVLEHVPPEFTMLVVRRLLDVARRGVFLSISFLPDVFGLRVGQPLHKTVRPFSWWKTNLQALGHVRECRDMLSAGVFFVEP